MKPEKVLKIWIFGANGGFWLIFLEKKRDNLFLVKNFEFSE
jgi:hypothetical protein